MSYRPKQGTTTRTYYIGYSRRGFPGLLKSWWGVDNGFHAKEYKGILGALKAGMKWVTTRGPYEESVREKRLYKYTVTTKVERVA